MSKLNPVLFLVAIGLLMFLYYKSNEQIFSSYDTQNSKIKTKERVEIETEEIEALLNQIEVVEDLSQDEEIVDPKINYGNTTQDTNLQTYIQRKDEAVKQYMDVISEKLDIRPENHINVSNLFDSKLTRDIEINSERDAYLQNIDPNHIITSSDIINGTESLTEGKKAYLDEMNKFSSDLEHSRKVYEDSMRNVLSNLEIDDFESYEKSILTEFRKTNAEFTIESLKSAIPDIPKYQIESIQGLVDASLQKNDFSDYSLGSTVLYDGGDTGSLSIIDQKFLSDLQQSVLDQLTPEQLREYLSYSYN